MEKRKKRKERGRFGFAGVRIISSGGIVFKKSKGSVLWLITRSTPSIDYPIPVWRLPKGWLDDEDNGKTPGPLTKGEKKVGEKELTDTALREVAEEGGIKSTIIKKVGIERYFYINKERVRVFKLAHFYLMQWISDLAEGPGPETSAVEWLPYNEARKRLTHSGEKKMLDMAERVLGLGVQTSLV